MKKTLSVILAYCFISACGRGGSVEVLPKADNPSKTSTGLIITSVVLGAGLVVSVLVNVGLDCRREITEQELNAALDVLQKSHPNETYLVYGVLCDNWSRIKYLNEQINTVMHGAIEKMDKEKNEIILNLETWAQCFKMYAQKVLESETISPAFKDHLQMIAHKNVREFKCESPPNYFFAV